MVGVIVVLLGLCAALAAFARVASDAERVRLAADQAALAGAAVVLGAAGVGDDGGAASTVGGTPCDAARATAERNGAELAACRELSTGVQVEARRSTILHRDVQAIARAGEGPQRADDAAPIAPAAAPTTGEALPRAMPAPTSTPVPLRGRSGPNHSPDALRSSRAAFSGAGS